MIKYVLGTGAAFGALLGASAQAAPLVSDAATLHGQVQSETVKVAHCRSWSGGWNCGVIVRPWWGGGHSRYRSHWRWGSRRY